MNIPKIPDPTNERVQTYLHAWTQLPNYPVQERALSLVFKEFKPNTKQENIFIKVWTLNDAYSTHILDVPTMVKHIHGLNVDDHLAQGNVAIVEQIAQVPSGRRHISFASKFASFHNNTVFPIYDYFVVKVLKHFRRTTKFTKYSNDELTQYALFVEAVKQFQGHFGLDCFSLKELDKYLWLLGKDFFKKTYKKKTT